MRKMLLKCWMWAQWSNTSIKCMFTQKNNGKCIGMQYRFLCELSKLSVSWQCCKKSNIHVKNPEKAVWRNGQRCLSGSLSNSFKVIKHEKGKRWNETNAFCVNSPQVVCILTPLKTTEEVAQCNGQWWFLKRPLKKMCVELKTHLFQHYLTSS